MITDNGPQFVLYEFETFLSDFGVKDITTSLYHPRSNGLVERCNRMIKENIQLSVASGLDWVQEVKNVIWAWRTTPNSNTKVSPFVLLKGRLPGSKMNRLWMKKKMVSVGVMHDVNEKRLLAQDKYSTSAQKFLKVNFGDMVRVKLPFRGGKRESRFSSPKKVINVSDFTVTLNDGKCWNKERLSVIHNEHTPGTNDLCKDRHGITQSVVLRKSCRSSKVPARFQDFVLKC